MNTLFPYQKGGSEWLASKRYALLADEMGLGKSAQAVVASDLLNARPVLILCPAVARYNWMREWQKFSSRTSNIAVVIQAADASAIASADVTICSYDLTANNAVMAQLSRRRWAACFLDECHFLKSAGAGRAKAVMGKNGIIHRCDRVWALSGTPAPNHSGELWILLYVFGVTTLTDRQFMERYTVEEEVQFRGGGGHLRSKMVVRGNRNVDELKAILQPVMLRRKKDQVMTELPKIFYQDVVVEPRDVPIEVKEKHFANYIIQPKQFGIDIDAQQRALQTLVADLGLGNDGMKILEGLDPKVKTLRRWIGLQKVYSVLDMVRGELESGAYEKIVLFGVHRCVIEELQEGLKDFGAVSIYGGTDPKRRDRAVKRFQEDPRCRVFVGQTVAAGTAITLTAAHHVGVVEADWVPANNQQAVMRVHRIGQTKPVTVRFFSMANSVDERVQQVLKRKTRDLTELFDTPADPFSED
ncbi:MAG: DEAD/DEAH box helicase [Alphaproteobacteria bacterium]|nr:DEAD/DEAH box helicase [Alphaproteobacteria bacterium]